MSKEKNSILTIVGKDTETKNEIAKAVSDYETVGKEKGINAQVDLGAYYIASDIQKTKALNVFAMTLKDMGTSLKAYEKALGRKLSAKDIQDFKEKHTTPSLFEDIDDDLLELCNKNLNMSKQLTYKK